MIELNNLHQPYIFKFENKLNIIVTERYDTIVNYSTNNRKLVDSHWKIKLLNENFEKVDIETPNTLIIKDIEYNVLAECSPFIQNSKISYIATVNIIGNKSLPKLYLVEADFNYQEKKVENPNVLYQFGAAFKKDEFFYYADKNSNKIITNSTKINIPSLNGILDDIIRVMGVQDKNDVLITGNKNNKEKTILWNYNLSKFQLLTDKNGNDNIYKSSIYGNELDGLLVHTEKKFTGIKDEQYKLKIETGYNLIDI